jgi:hypothetical protein
VLLLAFVLSLVLSQVSPAFAQADKPTGLLILKVDGEQLGEAEKSAVAKNLKAELEKYKKYALSEAPDLDLLEAMVEFECLDIDAACLASIASKKDVQQVLYVKVDGGAAQLVLVDVKTSKELARDERKAEGNAALQAAVTGPGREAVFGPAPEEPKPVVAVVAVPVPAPAPAAPAAPAKPEPEVKKVDFTIDSNVKDSKVFINDKDVGVAPVAVKLKPGRYTFRVEREGFLSVEEKIQVAQVGAKAWKASLKPVPVQKAPMAAPMPAKKDSAGKPIYATWWFWTAVGAGVVAATVTTAVLMSEDSTSGTYGTAKFSIDPGSAAYDAVFYQNAN